MSEKFLRKLNFEAVHRFVEDNYLKNRTTVTRDIPVLMDNLEKTLDVPIRIHRYKTGEDHGTWVVPKEWNVKEAWIKDAEGNTIASYAEHPLFLAPYSCSVDRKVSKEELEKHVLFSSLHPEAYAYNWRLAYDPHLCLKDWSLSIPLKRWEAMKGDSYHVFIDIDERDGEMFIGEVSVPGSSEETFVFIADYCHPGQVNDSFSGVVLFMEVMKTLSQQNDLRYNYSLLLLPETIGSSVYLASPDRGNKKIVGSLFADSVSWGKNLYLQNTRRWNTYLDQVARAVTHIHPKVQTTPFISICGNDERVFDSPQVGIPSLSLNRETSVQNHTSQDNLTLLDRSKLEEAYAVTLTIINLLERDSIYRFTHSVPFHMSRFQLYADWENDRSNFEINRKIMEGLDGKTSLLELANDIDIPFARVEAYVAQMEKHDLVRRSHLPPLVRFNANKR